MTESSLPAGKVWLVGAGPGEPGLITVRGVELLREADVVLFDALSHPALLSHCSPHAELRNVGKRGGKYSPTQKWITEQLIELSNAGKRVVRLKGGDSFLFARGAEEAEDLVAAGVPFEVVPGLSSPVATSAYAGIPLTHRDLSSSVTFITGSDKAGSEWSSEAWEKLATATDTLCILMGMRRIARIMRALQDGGRSVETPVAVVQWGARPEQQVVTGTLSTIADAVRERGVSNPAVIIVGEVVSLRETLSWFEKKPLFGQRILVPRPPHQAASTAKLIRERGAEPVLVPVIEIFPPSDPQPLRAAIADLASYQWVLFTSANGVDRFFSALFDANLDARALGSAKLGVIGPKTAAALVPYGVRADLVAKEFVGEGLAKAVLESTVGSAPRVLIPRAEVAREQLPESLRANGLKVNVVPAYKTVGISGAEAEALASMLRNGQVDIATFTSSSTVTSTVQALGVDAKEILGQVTVASIGPITTKTALDLGITVHISAEQFTVPGLLDAIQRYRLNAPD